MDEQLGLFGKTQTNQPLAYKARPKSWDKFLGQKTIIQKVDRLNFNNLDHLVFYGPPGCGKTTLAFLLAQKAGLELYNFNAVLGGVNDLRQIIKKIENKNESGSSPSIIFIDEIHRFNKAQQDALLPYLEDRTFILFGATTENPRTTLNKAILSRIGLWRLNALEPKDIVNILNNILTDKKKDVSQELVQYIADNSYGDARFAINQISIILDNYNEIQSLQEQQIIKDYLQINRVYDKDQDRHYDVISAFIKSVRGSDPDAALLWLAVMLEGGEDIEFIARRLLILASEDIGNADPRGLLIAQATHYTITKIGMPEARIPLAQATVYLANAPKSNSSYLAIDRALDYVRNSPAIDVPTHLRNHHPDKKNYQYPHSYPNHWCEQEYMPKKVIEHFYNSSKIGFERHVDLYQKEIRKK